MHTCALQDSSEYPGGPSAGLWSSLFMQLSPLWYSVLQTLAILTFPDYQVGLLNSACQASAISSLPVLRPGNSLQTLSWGSHRAHLICFPYRGLLSLVIQCLKTVVSCILSGLIVLVSGRRINLVPVTLS